MRRESHEFTEHVVKDSSVLEVGDLGVGINSAGDSEALSSVGGHSDVLTDCEVSSVDVDVEGFRTIEAKMIGTFTSLELHGENTHADKV